MVHNKEWLLIIIVHKKLYNGWPPLFVHKKLLIMAGNHCCAQTVVYHGSSCFMTTVCAQEWLPTSVNNSLCTNNANHYKPFLWTKKVADPFYAQPHLLVPSNGRRPVYVYNDVSLCLIKVANHLGPLLCFGAL